MSRIIECIPNFSVGQDEAVIEGLVAIVRSAPVSLLDYSADPDHNRLVITFAGDIEDVTGTAFMLARQAVRTIDMRRHRGAHPRIGALDVLPLVPLQDTSPEECIAAARCLGRRIADELALPVYYYGLAALSPGRVRLADIRRGGFEGLAARMSEPEGCPDEGPCRPHPTAGALALAVRRPLIAYNVNLDTDDLEAARSIARRIRASSGGLPGVEALGVRMERTGMAQVTVNLRERDITSLDMVYQAIVREAAQEGVGVAGAELIGLLPLDEVIRVFGRQTGLAGFSADRILEWKMLSAEEQ